jgi:hypothetical protein
MPSAVKMPGARARDDASRVLPVRGRAILARLPATGLFVLIIGLSFLLVDLLKRRARDAELFRVDPSRIELSALPDWAPGRLAGELRALVAMEPRSIFDATLRDDVRASLLRHSWVREVRDVRRLLPNRLGVELVLRPPAAVVEVGAWRLTIDHEGHVLDDVASRAPPDLPQIRGDKVSIPGIPEVGGRFRCQAVQDGLAVADELRRSAGHPFFRYAAVEAIDVRNVGAACSSEILLLLRCGAVVEWGSAGTGSLGPLELPASHKLDNLLLVHDRNPGLVGVVRIHAASRDPFVTLEQ